MATNQVALENLTYAGVQFHKVSFEQRASEHREDSENLTMGLNLHYSHGVAEEGHIFQWVIESGEDDPFAIEIKLAAVYQSTDGWGFSSEDDASSFYMDAVLPVLHQAVERVQSSLWGLFGVSLRLLPELSFFREHFDPRKANDTVEG